MFKFIKNLNPLKWISLLNKARKISAFFMDNKEIFLELYKQAREAKDAIAMAKSKESEGGEDMTTNERLKVLHEAADVTDAIIPVLEKLITFEL